MIFNEDKLQEEIIKTWGEFGVHNEVFKAMRKQISDLKEITLTSVVVPKGALCDSCNGTGYSKRKKCVDCDGSGNM